MKHDTTRLPPKLYSEYENINNCSPNLPAGTSFLLVALSLAAVLGVTSRGEHAALVDRDRAESGLLIDTLCERFESRGRGVGEAAKSEM